MKNLLLVWYIKTSEDDAALEHWFLLVFRRTPEDDAALEHWSPPRYISVILHNLSSFFRTLRLSSQVLQDKLEIVQQFEEMYQGSSGV